eukprot:gene4986-3581_t
MALLASAIKEKVIGIAFIGFPLYEFKIFDPPVGSIRHELTYFVGGGKKKSLRPVVQPPTGPGRAKIKFIGSSDDRLNDGQNQIHRDMDPSVSPPSLFEGPCCILAPMVRVGHLGFRAMCLDHGADVAFSEEIVAAKLAQCKREVTCYPLVPQHIVEFVCYESWKNRWKRTVVFSTLQGAPSPHGKPATVLQLGVADPAIAGAAALLVYQDVDGIDVNMGCPKRFSVSNGFGAALMKKTATAGQILRSIHDTANSADALKARGSHRLIHLSFKCRLLETPEKTFNMLCEILEAAGHTAAHAIVHGITIHARYISQLSETPPRYDEAKDVIRRCREDPRFSALHMALNGSLESREDALKKCQLYGFDAGMLARSAMRDPSVFGAAVLNCSTSPSPKDLSHYLRILREMLGYAVRYRTPFNNFKYQVQRIVPEITELKPLMHRIQNETRRYEDFIPILEAEPDSLLPQWCRACAVDVVLLDRHPDEVDPNGAADKNQIAMSDLKRMKTDSSGRISLRFMCAPACCSNVSPPPLSDYLLSSTSFNILIVSLVVRRENPSEISALRMTAIPARQQRPNCIEQAWHYLDTILNSQSGLKVLLCDDALMSILSIAYSQHELLMHGVVLVQLLSNTTRFQMKHFSCVILCRPTPQSLTHVYQELAEANFSHYSLFFTTMMSSKKIESLAKADILDLVNHVQEIYIDSVPITEWVCISQLTESLEPISINSPLFNPVTLSQWSAGNVSRFAESVISFILSTNRRPVVRYRGGSAVAEQIADAVAERLTTVHKTFPDLRAHDCVLLILDRMDDPVTPLLMPWTYEAMIHELIGFQRGTEVIVEVEDAGPESPSPDANRHVVTPYTDAFFKEHRYDDWGQVCLAVSEMVKAYKEMNQFDHNTVSFEEIKNFMSQFPEAKKKSTLVTRHCTIASEMLAEINGRSLTKLSMLEQDMVTNTNVSEHSRLALEVVQDPQTDVDDALRVAMLYGLHYEKTSGNELGRIRVELQNRRCPTEKLALLDSLLKHGGEEYRIHNLFKQSTGHLFKSVAKAVGQFGKEVQNVLTGHTPLLRKLINRAYNGTLEVERYPVKDVVGSPIAAAQARLVRGKDILVIMPGGVTYTEAMLLSNVNNKCVDNNLESLMSFGKAVTRKFGGGGSETVVVETSGDQPTAKIEARVALLSTGFINSKEFIRCLPHDKVGALEKQNYFIRTTQTLREHEVKTNRSTLWLPPIPKREPISQQTNNNNSNIYIRKKNSFEEHWCKCYPTFTILYSVLQRMDLDLTPLHTAGIPPTMAPVAFTVEDRMMLRLLYVQQKALQVQMEAILAALSQSSASFSSPASASRPPQPQPSIPPEAPVGTEQKPEEPTSASVSPETNGPSPSPSPEAPGDVSQTTVNPDAATVHTERNDSRLDGGHPATSGTSSGSGFAEPVAPSVSEKTSSGAGRSPSASSCRSKHSRTSSIVNGNPLLSRLQDRRDDVVSLTKRSSSCASATTEGLDRSTHRDSSLTDPLLSPAMTSTPRKMVLRRPPLEPASTSSPHTDPYRGLERHSKLHSLHSAALGGAAVSSALESRRPVPYGYRPRRARKWCTDEDEGDGVSNLSGMERKDIRSEIASYPMMYAMLTHMCYDDTICLPLALIPIPHIEGKRSTANTTTTTNNRHIDGSQQDIFLFASCVS